MPVANTIERWHLYAGVTPHVIGLGDRYIRDQVIQIRDLPGPFYLRQLSFRDTAGKSVQMRDGVGRFFTSDFAPTAMLANPSLPMPVYPQLEYPYDGVFRYDVLQIETELFETLWVLLHGAHRVADPGEQLYPDNFRETEYTHQVTVTVTANSSQKIPVYLFFNTPFAIRALTGGLTAGATATFDTTVILRDHNGQAFSNRDLLWYLMFPRDGGNLPLTPSPELVIPAGRAYTLEVIGGAGAGTATFQFNFKGALLNAI